MDDARYTEDVSSCLHSTHDVPSRPSSRVTSLPRLTASLADENTDCLTGLDDETLTAIFPGRLTCCLTDSLTDLRSLAHAPSRFADDFVGTAGRAVLFALLS